MIDELTPKPVQLKCPLEELTLCEQVSSVTEEDKRVLVTDDVFQELNGQSRNRRRKLHITDHQLEWGFIFFPDTLFFKICSCKLPGVTLSVFLSPFTAFLQHPHIAAP